MQSPLYREAVYVCLAAGEIPSCALYLTEPSFHSQKNSIQAIVKVQQEFSTELSSIAEFLRVQILTGRLRDGWKFQGYVIDDAGAVNEVWMTHHYVNSSKVCAPVVCQSSLSRTPFMHSVKALYCSMSCYICKVFLAFNFLYRGAT